MKLCTARSLVSCPLGVRYDMVRPASQRQRSKVLCVDGRLGEDVGKIVGGRDGGARSRDLIIGGGAISAAPDARSVPGIPIQSRLAESATFCTNRYLLALTSTTSCRRLLRISPLSCLVPLRLSELLSVATSLMAKVTSIANSGGAHTNICAHRPKSGCGPCVDTE